MSLSDERMSTTVLEFGPLKAAPENRILARSCGETKAGEVAPEIRVTPETIRAPEEDRTEEVPRTAANTTEVIG